jgi:pimeloyl-ACP methyl ester carboxylesterase
MPRVQSNGLELEYDTAGDPADPALVLVMGLGAQLTGWEDELRDLFAAQGFHVIRFDNRDIGLSTSLDHLPMPDFAAIGGGDPTSAPYLLADLAQDTVGLLDALGIERAHVVGVSMGGMIAQELAIAHPERLLSLCSIMSTTGDRSVGQATPEALAGFGQPPGDREVVVERSIANSRVMTGPYFPFDEEDARAKYEAAYDRSYRPMGSLRQTAAVLSSPDRTEGLRGVRVPTVVIHGSADPLVDRSGGEATAAAIPDAELLIIDGLGHRLPPQVWSTIVEAVVRNAKRAV